MPRSRNQLEFKSRAAYGGEMAVTENIRDALSAPGVSRRTSRLTATLRQRQRASSNTDPGIAEDYTVQSLRPTGSRPYYRGRPIDDELQALARIAPANSRHCLCTVVIRFIATATPQDLSGCFIGFGQVAMQLAMTVIDIYPATRTTLPNQTCRPADDCPGLGVRGILRKSPVSYAINHFCINSIEDVEPFLIRYKVRLVR